MEGKKTPLAYTRQQMKINQSIKEKLKTPEQHEIFQQFIVMNFFFNFIYIGLYALMLYTVYLGIILHPFIFIVSLLSVFALGFAFQQHRTTFQLARAQFLKRFSIQ